VPASSSSARTLAIALALAGLVAGSVTVAGAEVTLSGAVQDTIAMRQAQAIAEEVAGISHVHNRLQLRESAERETTPGKTVNAALGTGEKP